MESPSPGKIELPKAFEQADIDHLVVLIADMLDRLIQHNDKIPLSPEALTRFHSRSPPTISVLDYLRRIVKYANVERTCLLITLHYIDQICSRLPHFTLSSLTCHRFIITAVVVASKALCDSFCTNAHYAKVGGIRVGELNVLEKELLSSLDWRLTSTREVLDAYYVNLIRTNSTGAYTLAAESTSPALTDVDSDMDSLLSASPSPSGVYAMLEDEKEREKGKEKEKEKPTREQQQQQAANGLTVSSGTGIEPTAVLINRATLSPKPSTGPTIEQNMAFEALRMTTSSSSTMVTSRPVSRTTSQHAGTGSFSEDAFPAPPPSSTSTSTSTSTPASPAQHGQAWKKSKRNSATISVMSDTSNNNYSMTLSPAKRRAAEFAGDEEEEGITEDVLGTQKSANNNNNNNNIDVDIDSTSTSVHSRSRPRTRLRIDYDGRGVG